MEGVGSDCSVSGFDVRRNGEADLFGDRRVVQAVDCFAGEPAASPNAGKLEEDIGLGPRMSETFIRTADQIT